MSKRNHTSHIQWCRVNPEVLRRHNGTIGREDKMSRVNRSPDSGDVVPQWDIPRTWSKPLLWLHWLQPRCLSVGLTLLPYFSCPSRRLHVPGTFNFFGLSLWFGPHFPSFMHGPCRLLVGNPQSFPRGLTFLRNLVEVSVSLWCDSCFLYVCKS